MSDLGAPRRGDIWMLDFNPGRGSEQAGRRPALVLQNDIGNANPRYPNTIVAAISTKGKPVPFHVKVPARAENGLRETSFVKCEQLLTVSKARLLGRRALGRITADQIRRVEIAVLLSLGIDR
jgi:mRNA interferase MazF